MQCGATQRYYLKRWIMTFSGNYCREELAMKDDDDATYHA
jgi:hypothetical protein